MRVLLATSWDTPCGIADYAAALKESVEAADPGIEVTPAAEALDPVWAFQAIAQPTTGIGLVHLNHHDALHSRWTPGHVADLVAQGTPVVVTFHDTRAGTHDAPNSDKLREFVQLASSVVVHEPTEDVRAIYWRQGIPAAAQGVARYTPMHGYATWMDGTGLLYPGAWKAFPQQPVLGTVGFNFPWKNYDRLAEVTAEEGWALLILCANATPEDEARWKGRNPSTLVVREFLPQPIAINYLAGCDATAFMYTCANNGTSGAIRQGIAARKPVIAQQGCRQFRDLYEDPLAREAIQWVGDWEELRETLRRIPSTRFDPLIHALAERDSWRNRGRDYARLYRMLVTQGVRV